MPASVPAQLYPDVAAHGSLAAALGHVAEQHGLDLDRITASSDGWVHVGARLARAHRIATVVMGSEERWFISELWSRGVCLSRGKTADLVAMAGALDLWCRGATLTDLHDQYSFMEVGELALAHERGTAVDVKWRRLRESASDLVRPAVEAAAAQPMLRGLFPFLSHETLCFSRCTGYPYSGDVPVIQPVGASRFRVRTPDGTTVADEVTAVDAVAAAVAALPPGCGPAVAGTAHDLPEQ
jgi:hypothetical protein